MTDEEMNRIMEAEQAEEDFKNQVWRDSPSPWFSDLEEYEKEIAADLREEGARVVGNCVKL